MNNNLKRIKRSVLIGLACGIVVFFIIYFRIDIGPSNRSLKKFDENSDNVKFVVQYLLPVGVFIVMAAGSYFAKSE
jgi:hypothetical protein